MKKFYLLLVLLISPFLGCNEETDQKELYIDKFPETHSLEGDVISEVTLGHPSQIVISDSLLIILNGQGNYFFEIYNLNTLDLLTKFGTSGRGPEEFDSPRFTGQVKKINHNKYHLVYDWKRKKMNYINFQEKITNASYLSESEILPEEVNDAFNFVYHSDSLSIVVPTSEKKLGRFKIFENGQVSMVDYLPKLPFEVHENNKHSVYTTVSSGINLDLEKFIATPLLLGQYDFFDLSGNFLHTSIYDRDENLIQTSLPNGIFEDPIKMFSTEIITENSMIYILNTDITQVENPSDSRVHVIDWNGTPIQEYLLNRPVFDFAVDLKHNYLYGLSYANNNGVLIKYDLNTSRL